LIGKSLAHYEILEQIGQGGMGTVYAAHDHKHDRRVALKTIRPQIAETLGRELFLQEISLAARLSHPHILPVFDSGEADGLLFFIMPLVEGETLRSCLARDSRLHPAEAIHFTQQIARALMHAHARSIVHLDIKPENILLSGADAVVADFGLARAIDVAGKGFEAEVRAPIRGTPAYMSPEQVSGASSIDHRSDLYSLGCVFYEMLTGTPPFAAPSRRELIRVRLQRELPSLPEDLGSWCEKLDPILLRLASRSRDQRIDSAEELLRLLATFMGIPDYLRSSDARKSLLVLPFQNNSPDPDNDYFSDGLTDELINDLSRLRGLRVISRTSSMQLKGSPLSLIEIGHKLNVGHVVEGSVRRSGNDLRITCQLVHLEDDRLVWSDKHDGNLDDVFGIQERVAHAIADALKQQLAGEQVTTVKARGLENIAAYDYYLRARKDIFSYSSTGLDRAIDHLLAAVEVVGENVMLFRGLGMAFWQYCNAGIAPDPHFLDQVNVYADAIERLEPGSASASTLRGLASVQRGDLEDSIRHLREAYTLEPHDPDVMLWLAAGYCLSGHTNLARPIIEVLMSIDPLTPVNTWIYAFVDYVDGDFEAAANKIQIGLASSPDRLGMCWENARFLAAGGKLDEALRCIEDALERSSETDSVFHEMLLQFRAAVMGDRQGVWDACTDPLRRMVSMDMEYPQAIGDCFALVGEVDEALEWYRLAVQRGFIHERFLAEFNPFLEPIRPDPRFGELMKEVERRQTSLSRILG
jgi:serine/threonine protein kinase